MSCVKKCEGENDKILDYNNYRNRTKIQTMNPIQNVCFG